MKDWSQWPCLKADVRFAAHCLSRAAVSRLSWRVPGIQVDDQPAELTSYCEARIDRGKASHRRVEHQRMNMPPGDGSQSRTVPSSPPVASRTCRWGSGSAATA